VVVVMAALVTLDEEGGKGVLLSVVGPLCRCCGRSTSGRWLLFTPPVAVVVSSADERRWVSWLNLVLLLPLQWEIIVGPLLLLPLPLSGDLLNGLLLLSLPAIKGAGQKKGSLMLEITAPPTPTPPPISRSRN